MVGTLGYAIPDNHAPIYKPMTGAESRTQVTPIIPANYIRRALLSPYQG